MLEFHVLSWQEEVKTLLFGIYLFWGKLYGFPLMHLLLLTVFSVKPDKKSSQAEF
jgi:hypothetical protein